MRAAHVIVSAGGPVVTVGEAEVPRPVPGEVLVEVHAAGVTPTELLWYPTSHSKSGGERRDAIPGHEFSGVVAAVGAGVDQFSIGDAIYGMNDWFADGGTAEFCLTVPASIAPKPVTLTHEEAAAVPIGALTAWQALHGRARLRAGERVLVHGGSGAVGVFALQFAKAAGAHVTTTVSSKNFEFVRSLGADEVIDYGAGRFEDTVGAVDVVLDLIGGETLERSWSLLAPGGRMVTIATSSEGQTDERIKHAFFIVEPDSEQLKHIAAELDAGRLRVFVDAVVPLAQAPAAYAGELRQRQGRGKVVVSL